MYRRFMVSLVVVLLLCLVVVPVFAVGTVEDSYNFANLDSYAWIADGPYPDGSVSCGRAQNFNASFGGYLKNVTVAMARESATTNMSLRMFVAECGGDIVGTPSTWLETSVTTVDTATLSTYPTYTNVTFGFSGGLKLTQYNAYVWAIYVSSFENSDHLLIGADGSSPAHAGKVWLYASGAGWTETADRDYVFVVESDTTFSGGSGSWGAGSTDSTIGGLMWWFIYLIVMLAPAYFLGVFCKMGKWGFVIGLGVGAGLGYAFLTGFPLWLLILVAVGEAGLVYSTVSREG